VRQRLALLAALVLVVVVLCALTAGLIAPNDPERQDYRHVLEPPSPGHLVGDRRDVDVRPASAKGSAAKGVGDRFYLEPVDARPRLNEAVRVC
jgi:N-terminal TM domain of oligopeptide transport permease C